MVTNMFLDELKKYDSIIVIGHSNPDVDSIVSAKILSEILKHYGVNATYAVLNGDKPDAFNMKMIKDCMTYNPMQLRKESIYRHKFILVDHNDASQSIMDPSQVVYCIDHHNNSMQIKNIYITDYCCTSLVIYSIFKDYYDFSVEQKKQIFMAFMGDTKFGKSSRYKNKDAQLAVTLGFQMDFKMMFKKYFLPTDISKGISSVFNRHGYKHYKFDNEKVESSYIERFDIEGLDEFIDLVKNYNGNYIGLWFDMEKENSYLYFKYKGTLLEKKYNTVVSRATTVMNDCIRYMSTLDPSGFRIILRGRI